MLLLLLPCAVARPGCAHSDKVLRNVAQVPQQYVGDRRSQGYANVKILFDFDGIDKTLDEPTVIYIKRLFTDAREWLRASLLVRGSRTLLKLQDDSKQNQNWCADQKELPTKYKNGVDADLVIFVHARNEATVCQEGKNLAYATHCLQDQYDRPIAGFVQLCPKHHREKRIVGDRDEDLHTAIHEMLHVMGFSEALYPFWRDRDGEPRTKRCIVTQTESEKYQIVFPPGSEPYRKDVSYQGNEYCCSTNLEYSGKPPFNCKYAQSYGQIRYQVSENTLSKRGGGDQSVLIKTPNVVRIAREHFGCPNLAGLQLEDDGKAGTAGSHWEKSLMMTEFMCASSSGFQNVKSSLTLALMEDTGWYKANYSMAETLLWGYKKGCAFDNQPQRCDPAANNGFCRPQSKFQCNFDRSGMGKCSQDAYMNGCQVVKPTNGMPVYFCNKFFGRERKWGGSCGGIDCSGAKYSDSSACFESTLILSGYQLPSDQSMAEQVSCYQYRCNESTNVLEIEDPTGIWRTCTSGNTTFSNVEGYSGYLKCPDDWSLLCIPRKRALKYNPLQGVLPAPKNSPYYLLLLVEMPYGRSEFDAEKEGQFLRAIVAVVQTFFFKFFHCVAVLPKNLMDSLTFAPL